MVIYFTAKSLTESGLCLAISHADAENFLKYQCAYIYSKQASWAINRNREAPAVLQLGGCLFFLCRLLNFARSLISCLHLLHLNRVNGHFVVLESIFSLKI